MGAGASAFVERGLEGASDEETRTFFAAMSQAGRDKALAALKEAAKIDAVETSHADVKPQVCRKTGRLEVELQALIGKNNAWNGISKPHRGQILAGLKEAPEKDTDEHDETAHVVVKPTGVVKQEDVKLDFNRSDWDDGKDWSWTVSVAPDLEGDCDISVPGGAEETTGAEGLQALIGEVEDEFKVFSKHEDYQALKQLLGIASECTYVVWKDDRPTSRCSKTFMATGWLAGHVVVLCYTTYS